MLMMKNKMKVNTLHPCPFRLPSLLSLYKSTTKLPPSKISDTECIQFLKGYLDIHKDGILTIRIRIEYVKCVDSEENRV